MPDKIQIVLDADVIIHFSIGGYLHLLPQVIPACMTYARYHHNVVGSSNLKDIKEYCSEFKIAYLTTWDFLYYAYKAGLMTKEDVYEFVAKVRNAGSILPDNDLETYYCSVF